MEFNELGIGIDAVAGRRRDLGGGRVAVEYVLGRDYEEVHGGWFL